MAAPWRKSQQMAALLARRTTSSTSSSTLRSSAYNRQARPLSCAHAKPQSQQGPTDAQGEVPVNDGFESRRQMDVFGVGGTPAFGHQQRTSSGQQDSSKFRILDIVRNGNALPKQEPHEVIIATTTMYSAPSDVWRSARTEEEARDTILQKLGVKKGNTPHGWLRSNQADLISEQYLKTILPGMIAKEDFAKLHDKYQNLFPQQRDAQRKRRRTKLSHVERRAVALARKQQLDRSFDLLATLDTPSTECHNILLEEVWLQRNGSADLDETVAKYFARIPEPNGDTYLILLNAYLQAGDHTQVIEKTRDILQKNLITAAQAGEVFHVLLGSVLSTRSADGSAIGKATQIMKAIGEAGHVPSVATFNLFFTICSESSGGWEPALRMIREMKAVKVKPDLNSYRLVALACSQLERPSDRDKVAKLLFKECRDQIADTPSEAATNLLVHIVNMVGYTREMRSGSKKIVKEILEFVEKRPLLAGALPATFWEAAIRLSLKLDVDVALKILQTRPDSLAVDRWTFENVLEKCLSTRKFLEWPSILEDMGRSGHRGFSLEKCYGFMADMCKASATLMRSKSDLREVFLDVKPAVLSLVSQCKNNSIRPAVWLEGTAEFIMAADENDCVEAWEMISNSGQSFQVPPKMLSHLMHRAVTQGNAVVAKELFEYATEHKYSLSDNLTASVLAVAGKDESATATTAATFDRK